MRANIKEKDALLYGLDRPVKLKGCDCPGCSEAGLYRAPKNREQLNEYFWFCLIHVRQYNESWDYYSGMSENEIEAHIRHDATWQRETRPLGGWRKQEQKIRDDVAREFFSEDAASFNARAEKPEAHELPATLAAALTVLELKPPVMMDTVKAQYKKLVKLHHPDLHGGSKTAEEKFKIINQAFAVVKMAYGADADAV